MRQVAAACRALLESEFDDLLSRVIETGIAATYARPFTKNRGRQALNEEWTPPGCADLALHAEVIKLRDTLFAHSDAAQPARGIEDVSLGTYPGGAFAEHYRRIDRDALLSLADLCDRQEARLHSRCRAIHEELRAGAATP